MPTISRALSASVFAITLTSGAVMTAQGALPVPPVKPGLWETRMTQLDASGQEVPSPELAALSRLPPGAREQMAEMMRARGVQMPDENGRMKACLSKESLDSGAWQQVAAESGCTTTYTTRSASAWKWHTSCSALKAESDGETVFTGSEAYRTKMTTTVAMNGTSTTSTRVIEGTWLGAACGDIKPMAAPTGRGR